MKKQKKQTGRTSGRTKFETLNRRRLDALGAALQASHQLDAAENTLDAAQNLFLSRSRRLEKAHRAFRDCLERMGTAKTSKITKKGGHHG